MIRALGDQPRKTVEDFMSLPEGTRAELIDGELFMSPAPRPRHQRVAFNLAVLLREHVTKRELGEVFIAPLDVHLPSEDIVEPDILFIAKANSGIVQDWIRGVPDLIVEVISPDYRKRDRVIKRDLYAQNGVREYWIVDPEARTIEVLSLKGDEYELAGRFGCEDILASPLLPELHIPLSTVFPDIG